MKILSLHPWRVSPQEGVRIQNRLRPRLDFRTLPEKIRYVAGTDVSISKKSGTIWAGVVVFSFPDLARVEEKWTRGKVSYPYIPGLLSFREIPLILRAAKKVKTDPQLIFCDGQGIAHPRGMGLASHLGLLLNKPTVGCAKGRLVGEFSAVGLKKGSCTDLWYKGEVVGAVLRTRHGVKPLFISPGNRITLEESVKMVLCCCKKYRMPEPTRQAHLLVTGLRRTQEAA